MSTSIFPKFINFLRKNTLLNVILLITYYLLVVLPHNNFGYWINEIFKPLGRDKYNLLIITLGGIGLLMYILLIWNGFKYNPTIATNKRKFIGYLSMTILFVVIAINTLLVINIEIVHFVQYAILAVLIFPIYQDYTATLFWAIMLALWDEAYQYWILNPQYDYYDFNDIILDLLGTTLGLLLIASYDTTLMKKTYESASYFDSCKNYFKKQPSVFWGTVVFLSFSTLAYNLKWLKVYPQKNGIEAPIQLIRNYNPEFWQTVPKGFIFHVVQPLEGTVILIALFIFFTGIGR